MTRSIERCCCMSWERKVVKAEEGIAVEGKGEGS